MRRNYEKTCDLVQRLNAENLIRQGQGPSPGFGEKFGECVAHPEWWNMPRYEVVAAATPYRDIRVFFSSQSDVEEFFRLLGVTPRRRGFWFSPPLDKPKDWLWVGGPNPQYPVFIPTKGRWERLDTSRNLSRIGVPHYIVVEPMESAPYREAAGRRSPLATVLTMPFGSLGRGSIPARNWIWERAAREGARRHWIFDDNIPRLYRVCFNRRMPVGSGAFLRAVEDWSDRYENVALSGLADSSFTPDVNPRPPITLNTRIYSMTLIRTDLPYRWRGKWNEDTDLCIRALKDGWVTAQFNALCGDKRSTKNAIDKGTRGGNTGTVYKADDWRLAFAESLQRQHPDVVEVVWRFHRWHHVVDYSRFKANKLVLREGVTPMDPSYSNEYGMELRRVSTSRIRVGRITP